MPAINAYLEPVDELNIEYPLAQMAAETGFELATLEQWADAIERKQQAILYGPPGTGKTYVAQKLADHIIGGSTGKQGIVQFHPAYAYEDFIQGLRPIHLPPHRVHLRQSILRPGCAFRVALY